MGPRDRFHQPATTGKHWSASTADQRQQVRARLPRLSPGPWASSAGQCHRVDPALVAVDALALEQNVLPLAHRQGVRRDLAADRVGQDSGLAPQGRKLHVD